MKSTLCLIALLGGYGEPVARDGVVIHNYTTTFEGSSITFTCEDGLFPNVTITANCTGEGHWSTDPATYMCINITCSTTTGTTTNTITTDSSSATINTTNISTNTINHTAGEDSQSLLIHFVQHIVMRYFRRQIC